MSTSSHGKRPVQGITGTAITLVVIGVVGSVVSVVGLVLVLLFWVPRTWTASSVEPVLQEASGPGNPYGAGPDVSDPIGDAKADPEKEKTTLAPAEALPPAPRPMEFFSPLPKEIAEALAAEGPANAELAADVVRKVKEATVYLRVTLADGKVGQGSGFFALEPGLILTNAHVVGMLHPDSQQPRKIEVIQNSGTRDEKKYEAQLLGWDRHSDLAVLRFKSSPLLAPLEVKSARGLRETQRVWVVGFPLGERLGKEITVSDSSISSLRREPNGLVSRVQVNGGMNPGNSGGPVVNARGDVVGVAVSGFRGTQINFAVPGDYVRLILDGRISGLLLGQPIIREGKTHVTATLSTIDPLRQMRHPFVEVWTGNPTPSSRPASNSRPAALADDSGHERQMLNYKNSVARGDLLLPALPSGRSYWLQPGWTDAAGQTRWANAQVCSVPPPVTQQPISLFHKQRIGDSPLVLNQWLTLQVSDPLRGDASLAINSQAKLTETVPAIDEQGLASVQLQYRDYNAEAQVDNHRFGRDPELAEIRREISGHHAYLQVDPHGNCVSRRMDSTQETSRSKQRLEAILRDIELTIETMSVPLPNREVKPGENWRAERTLPLDQYGPWVKSGGIYDLTYSYLGSRPGPTGPEAVLALSGKLRQGQDQSQWLKGYAEGTAVVNLQSGQVSQVDALFAFELEMRAQNRAPGRTSGTLNIRLQRGSSSVRIVSGAKNR
jgi:S1-C subfamily serine protease